MDQVWLAAAISTGTLAIVTLTAALARSKERRDAAKDVLRIIFRSGPGPT